MTLLRCTTDEGRVGLSNWFAAIIQAKGHRGSSYTDLDAVTHDRTTGRFLIQEFKPEGATVNQGQLLTLQALASLRPTFTVWVVVKCQDLSIALTVLTGSNEEPELILSPQGYLEKYLNWWNDVKIPARWVPKEFRA